MALVRRSSHTDFPDPDRPYGEPRYPPTGVSSFDFKATGKWRIELAIAGSEMTCFRLQVEPVLHKRPLDLVGRKHRRGR